MAVEGLDLTVEAGEIFGFVGPNGAGKTTTIRIMSTLARPTGGDVRIAGHSIQKDPQLVRFEIGYMPDFFGVYNDMKVWEYLDFFAACYRVDEAARKTLIEDLMELFDLHARRDEMVDKLSRGMKQRLSLARTLVNDPQVLILDEPASGLDPRARVEIRELMVQLAHMGKTVFFSTHILADVAEICTRVGIIEAGKMVVVGELDALQQQVMPRRKVEITVLGPVEAAQTVLQGKPGVSTLQVVSGQSNGERQRIALEFSGDDAQLSELLAALIRENIAVIQFNPDTRDLEAVFMRATQGLVA
jgi:ABC-2 type transport system ATP-binding protein